VEETPSRPPTTCLGRSPPLRTTHAAVAELLPTLGELPADDLRVAPVLAFGHFLHGRMDDATLTLGALGGLSSRCAWANAPWFADQHLLAPINVQALCEATLRPFDQGAEPGPPAAGPWLLRDPRADRPGAGW
jgi:hypothetical protein